MNTQFDHTILIKKLCRYFQMEDILNMKDHHNLLE